MYNIPPLFKDPNIRLELYQMLFEVAKINKELYHKDIHSGNHLPAYLCYRLKDLNHPAVIQLHLARLEPIGHCKAMDPDHQIPLAKLLPELIPPRLDRKSAWGASNNYDLRINILIKAIELVGKEISEQTNKDIPKQ